MIFIYNPKELNWAQESSINKLRSSVRWSGPKLCIARYEYDLDEVGAPARSSGGPSLATNIPVVSMTLMR